MILEGRDRLKDLGTVANYILRGLHTAWRADYGRIEDVNGNRHLIAAWQILAELDFEDHEGRPDGAAQAYARTLWRDAGSFLRAKGAPPIPPPPPRPPWADMASKDGALVLTIPDELIPFVGIDPDTAPNEIAALVGMVWAHDCGEGNQNYLSPGFVRARFEIRVALWRTRRQLALLQAGVNHE